ncbi:hypothetical protein SAMN05421639_1015 [Chryseobacterium shigense]|uniref:Uncharacterized protein n=1 Tax=Chryseobacterium shigense TaxID=297244 RepID=A0A1N7HSN7_9FLAO|nr:hypothetical protein SAMN05421639_1015 [Chryseobacterium shigense]
MSLRYYETFQYKNSLDFTHLQVKFSEVQKKKIINECININIFITIVK